MKANEYFLPPNLFGSYAEVDGEKGYLEIEVIRINLITNKSEKTSSSSLYKYNKKNSDKKIVAVRKEKILTDSATVTLVWFGEETDTAGSFHISCAKVKKNTSIRKPKVKQEQKTQSSNSRRNCSVPSAVILCHNKIRYSVRSQLELFLDYLTVCPPIRVFVAFKGSANSQQQVHLGEAQLPLPAQLLKKYATNYVNSCNFEHKTKIYALYRNIESGTASSQIQQQQQLKIGEIQLRFKMLFARTQSANAINRAIKLAPAKPQDQIGAIVEQQQTGKDSETLLTNGFHHHQPHTKFEENQLKEGDQTVRLSAKTSEIMEAMKKLDANLVALLTAGVEDDVSPKSDKVGHLDAKLSPLAQLVNGGDKNARAVDVDANSNLCTEQPQPLDLFKSIKAVKLQMEALTLQPEGTKRMELQQSEIRPIFTVECQLSQELIKSVERYDMFNIMQFESEKFQSLTQCTRFGQEAERAVHLQLNAKDNNGNFDDVFNFGRIHFTVWWREPGTCLNEMLGMGVLELEELYKASLLEQCKCITINRRDEHLASIYLKISLQIPNDNLLSSCVRYNCGVVVDSDNRDGDVSDASYKSGANCGATNNNNGSGNANNSIAGYAGEYVKTDRFLFPQDTKIQ